MMWLVLGAAIVVEVAATLSMRASDGFRKKIWLIPVIVGYVASFALLSLSLSLGMPVGIAYGVWSACGWHWWRLSQSSCSRNRSRVSWGWASD